MAEAIEIITTIIIVVLLIFAIVITFIPIFISSTAKEEIIPTEIEQPAIVSNNQGKKIHYTAADIQSRFLKKKVTPTTKQKEENRFDRIADIAASMDYTNPLGELRQMKNELFALPVKGNTGVKN